MTVKVKFKGDKIKVQAGEGLLLERQGLVDSYG